MSICILYIHSKFINSFLMGCYDNKRSLSKQTDPDNLISRTPVP